MENVTNRYDDYCYCPACGQRIDWDNEKGNGEGYEEDCE